MKDNRFIELLNLYIDRQITEAETTELEAEIQSNPKRQAVYRQYCQIHAATKLVYDSFRVNATEQPVLPTERAGVVELFETKRRRNHFAYYTAAGFAAAACLTLVFLRHNSTPGAGVPMFATKTEVRTPVAQPAAMEVVVVVPVTRSEPAAGPVSLRNSVVNPPDYTAMLAALREQDEERALASGRQPAGRGNSLFDDGLFNANRAAPLVEPRLFRIQQTQAQQVESTIFQFQR